MPQKCVHKGCGKTFSDPEENCIYHPEGPDFHEGQKGWKCCKPRVLTFDEFLSIPPCTTGRHSTVDDTPAPEANTAAEPEPALPTRKPIPSTNDTASLGATQPAPTAQLAGPIEPPESDSDDPSLPIPPNTTCRRRGCNASSSSSAGGVSRDDEDCIYHPGQAIFHEGSKGWTCCKRRVLEFDEFMKIEGCKQKGRHLFVGSGKKNMEEQKLMEVRHDFYQTTTTVTASLYLKKIDKSRAKVEFTSPTTVLLDLPTADQKRYRKEMPLFGPINQVKSTYNIKGTKLELTLAKADGASWPTLRSDEQRTSEIIQVGQAGRA